MRQGIGLLAVAALIAGAVQVTSSGAAGAGPHTVIVIDPRHPPASPVVQARLCGASPDCENGRDRIDVVDLVAGGAPSAPVNATVVTDESCTPDRYGISHCLNILRLRDGSQILVQHSHNMSKYACLSPGETVRVTALR